MFERITEAEINERSMANVSTTPNRPTAFGQSGMDAQALKLRFDRLSRYLAGRLNEIFTALNEGNFAQAVYINHEGRKVNLETFITNLLTGEVSDIQIQTIDGIVYLTELGNKVQEMYNGQDTGDLAKNIHVIEGITLKKFYEDFLEFEKNAVKSVNNKKGDVKLTAEDVGADPKGAADRMVYSHTISSSAHNDIRLQLLQLSLKLNALANSDDTDLDQLKEIVAYIKENKALIDSITTSKVSVSDIIDNLETDIPDKPLSAAQGVVLRALFDSILVPEKLSDLENDANFVTEETAPVRAVNGKVGDVTLNASDVGAEAAGSIGIHNTDSESHNDIRLLIEGLNSRLNALANSEDVDLDQMKELVDYIKDNRDLIEQITTNKVNYTDIIDNLTTNVKDKPLSAAQGVALKALMDALTTGKLDASELSNAINTALAQAKASGKFDGADGKTPYIQDGYWYIDGVNTNVKAEGENGVGISKVEKTATSGKVDTYTITFTNGTTFVYTVTNGEDYVLTPTDKQEIKDGIISTIVTQSSGESETLVMSQKAVTELVSDALGTGGTNEYETVDSVEEMTDTTKSYVLSSTGTLWSYVEEEVADIKNQFVVGSALENTRLRGNGEVQTGYPGMMVTNFIDVPKWENPYTVKISGVTLQYHSGWQYSIAMGWYNSEGQTLKVLATLFPTYSSGQAAKPNEKGEYVANIYNSEYSAATQVRFGMCLNNAVSNISAADYENLFIEFVPKNGTKIVGEWQDTGLEPNTSGGGNYVTLLTKIDKNAEDIKELGDRVTEIENNGASAKSGVVWYAVGDSITKGRGVASEDCWVSQVLKHNGYDADNSKNLGIGGLGFAKTDPNYGKTARNVVDENDFSGVGLVTVAIGINDWKEVLSIDTIKSEMRYCFEKILTDNPYCKIFFIAPFNISIRGSESTNWALGYTGSDVTGGSLRNFIDTQISVCEEYGIQVIDMSNSCVINKKSINTVLSDGVHPDTACHKALGRELARRITFA